MNSADLQFIIAAVKDLSVPARDAFYVSIFAQLVQTLIRATVVSYGIYLGYRLIRMNLGIDQYEKTLHEIKAALLPSFDGYWLESDKGNILDAIKALKDPSRDEELAKLRADREECIRLMAAAVRIVDKAKEKGEAS